MKKRSTRSALVAQREELRNSYKPSVVRLLLIAESPPASGGFFYNPMTIGRDYLFAETMRTLGFFPDDEEMRKDKDKTQHLNSFRSKGYFLVDTSHYPVDKMKQPKRDRTLIEELPRLMKEVEELNPEMIVIVKKNVFSIVRPALERLGFADRILNREFLPFPSHGHQREYRRRLRKLLANRRPVERSVRRN